MKVTKSILVSILFLLLGAGLVFAGGGGQAQSGAAAAAGPEKVYLYHWSLEENAQMLLDNFNKDFAGKYELVYEKLPDARTMTINTALASGADVSVMTQGSAFDLKQRSDSGLYMGLKQFLDKENVTYQGVFGDSVEQTMNINGDYYAVPYGFSCYMVYFNKKMFDDAGIPYPDPNWTWADFRETSRRLTRGTGADKVYGSMILLGNDFLEGWGYIAAQKLGNFWFYNPDFRSTRFDHPAMKESLQYFYDLFMVDRSAVPMDEYSALRYADNPTAVRALANGKYAMWVTTDFGCFYLTENYGPKVAGENIIGLTNIPRPVDSSGPVTVTYTSTCSISANARSPEGAWTLLKYMCIDHPEYFAAPKGMHPGNMLQATPERAKFFSDLVYRNKPGLDYNMAMQARALPRTYISRDNTIFQGQARINALINANMSLVFNGEMSVDEALRDLKTKGDQYITEDLN